MLWDRKGGAQKVFKGNSNACRTGKGKQGDCWEGKEGKGR